MGISQFRFSDRGQMALPAEARRRWNLVGGGSVEIANLGDALLIVPAGRGLRALLRDAVEGVGGYAAAAAAAAAAAVADDEPDLA